MKIHIVLTSRVIDGDESQKTTQTLNGFLRKADNSLEITYREQGGEEGLGNTLTTLRLFPEKLELSRTGDYDCLLTMEPGRLHESVYRTPFGTLTLTTETASLCSCVTAEKGGELSVCYTLCAAGGQTVHNLHLQILPY